MDRAGRSLPNRLRVALAAIAGSATSIIVVLALVRAGASPQAPPIEAGLTRAQFTAARAAVLRDVPAAQRRALGDRQVTTAEYEAAVKRAMACLRAELIAASPVLARHPPTFVGPAWSDDRFTYAYSFRLVVADLDPRPLDRWCQAESSEAVETVFHLQRLADPAYVGRTTHQFHRCLDRARLPGDANDPPRRRYQAVLASPAVDDQAAIEARKCIGAIPSIGDLNP